MAIRLGALEEELKIFYAEASQAARFLYSYLASGVVSQNDNRVHHALNENAPVLEHHVQSLQMCKFIVLGRIFDREAPHGIASLLNHARQNAHRFSRDELRQRKAPIFANDVAALNQYIAEAIEPTNREFARLERLVDLYSSVYDRIYREIRNRVFAHKVYSTPEEVDAVFKQTKVDEVQRLVTFHRSR